MPEKCPKGKRIMMIRTPAVFYQCLELHLKNKNNKKHYLLTKIKLAEYLHSNKVQKTSKSMILTT